MDTRIRGDRELGRYDKDKDIGDPWRTGRTKWGLETRMGRMNFGSKEFVNPLCQIFS